MKVTVIIEGREESAVIDNNVVTSTRRVGDKEKIKYDGFLVEEHTRLLTRKIVSDMQQDADEAAQEELTKEIDKAVSKAAEQIASLMDE